MELADALARISFLRHLDGASATRLAGLTNVNYLLRADDGDVVVRLPGIGTSDYIDRRAEEIAAASTTRAGVNAEVLFFDATDGLMVTRFVAGSTVMSPALFGDLGAVARAAEVMRRLHHTADPFVNEFTVAPAIANFKATLLERGAPLPDGCAQVERLADAALARLAQHPVPLVPSHCDPLCENFLDTGDRMYLIDFEYAGNFDPMWDLGDFSVEASLSSVQDDVLLRAYFGADPPADQAARMVIYKALCDLMWAYWGILQHINANPVEDFWAYGLNRFQRCERLMQTSAYAEAVARLR